jgi:hypothetical protein
VDRYQDALRKLRAGRLGVVSPGQYLPCSLVQFGALA